jgi:hypothetical protein
MQDAAGGSAIVPSEGRNESYHSIISELVSLIEHVQASMKMLESAIASEAAPDGQEAANVVILDDITPRYAQASAALNSCNAGLGVALHVLQDTGTAKHGTDERRNRKSGSVDRQRVERRIAMPWRPAEIQRVF